MDMNDSGVQRWSPGTAVVYAAMILVEPYMLAPVRVVRDEPDWISLYFADGTTYLERFQTNGQNIPRAVAPEAYASLTTTMVERQFPGQSILLVTKPGRPHAVRLSWEMPRRRFRGWYVNLQTPIKREARGFQSADQFLDIVVSPDRSWIWKDGDELEEAVSAGRVTREEAVSIREEGERVIPDIEAGRWPFDGSLTDWRPDPAWTIPSLSDVERGS